MIYVNSLSVNREIVKAGYAWVYVAYCKKPFCSEWKDLEKTARRLKIGIWSQPNPVPPWQFRKNKRSAFKNASPSITNQVGTYHGNRNSHMFHGTACKHYNCKNCTVIFKSREKAIEAGYRPCGNCRP